MGKVVLKKLIGAIVVVILLTMVIFMLIHLMPGDPVLMIIGENAEPEQIAALTHKLGLDLPLPQQYFNWVGRLLFQGSFGNSIVDDSAVMPQILERLPRTLALCIPSLLLSILIAVPLAVTSASHHNTGLDLGITSGSLLLMSIPEFYFGMLLLIIFAVVLKWLPASGYVAPDKDFADSIRHMILPVAALGIALAPGSIRLIRSSMLDVMNEDYIMLARTKGNSRPRVNYVHALRNSLIPISTSLCMQIASMMAGSLVVEKVFAYPGMGMLLFRAIQRRDYPMIQGCLFTFSLIIVLVNFLTDFIYMAIDPRIRVD